MPVVLLLVCLPWLLLLSVVLRTVRAGVPEWVPEAVAGLMVVAVLAIFFLLLISPGPAVDPVAAEDSLDASLRRLGASRAGTLGAWLASALLLLGGYALAAAGFARMELRGRPDGKGSLLGRGFDVFP